MLACLVREKGHRKALALVGESVVVARDPDHRQVLVQGEYFGDLRDLSSFEQVELKARDALDDVVMSLELLQGQAETLGLQSMATVSVVRTFADGDCLLRLVNKGPRCIGGHATLSLKQLRDRLEGVPRSRELSHVEVGLLAMVACWVTGMLFSVMGRR